jgi:hypothetical protein
MRHNAPYKLCRSHRGVGPAGPREGDRSSCLHTASTPSPAGGPASLPKTAEDSDQLLKELQDPLDDLPLRVRALGPRFPLLSRSSQVIIRPGMPDDPASRQVVRAGEPETGVPPGERIRLSPPVSIAIGQAIRRTPYPQFRSLRVLVRLIFRRKNRVTPVEPHPQFVNDETNEAPDLFEVADQVQDHGQIDLASQERRVTSAKRLPSPADDEPAQAAIPQ